MLRSDRLNTSDSYSCRVPQEKCAVDRPLAYVTRTRSRCSAFERALNKYHPKDVETTRDAKPESANTSHITSARG